MADVRPKTVGESLYWSYANLAMAYAAARHDEPTYQQIDYIVRAKTYYGLLSGRLNLGSLFIDERMKITSAHLCAYCGGQDHLTDHVIPRFRDGSDAADNLITACRSCNSSKGKRDLLEWFKLRKRFPSLPLLRRYLKLAIRYCVAHDLMAVRLTPPGRPDLFDGFCVEPAGPDGLNLPFALHLIPHRYPTPRDFFGNGGTTDAIDGGAASEIDPTATDRTGAEFA